MRILHVAPWYKPAYGYGGPTVSIPALCEALAVAGHEVAVYTTSANGAREVDVPHGVPLPVDGVEVTYFRRWTGDNTHVCPPLLDALRARARDFDVVHVHSWWNLVAMPAVAVCLARGVRPVCSPRGMLSPFSFARGPATRRAFHALAGRPLLARTHLHASSEQELTACLEVCRGAVGQVLPNFVFLPEAPALPAHARVAASSIDRPFRLVSLSRVHPIKRIDALLRALAAVRSPWVLDIAGDGEPPYVEELRRLAATLGIADRVRWIGSVGGARKFAVLAEADAFVLVSETESFANAVVESLAVGTPALVSPGVGLADYVARHAFGWVSGHGALAAAIEGAAASTVFRERVARDAPGKVRRDFASPALTARYETYYHDAVAGARAAPRRPVAETLDIRH